MPDLALLACTRASDTRRWPQAHQKLIEEKANGAALIASLKHEISGLVAYVPKESKESRVAAVSPMIEAGNVYLPAPTLYPWVNEFIAECCAFPAGKNDDQVDAMSQALLRLESMLGPPDTRLFTQQELQRAAARWPKKPAPPTPEELERKFEERWLYRG